MFTPLVPDPSNVLNEFLCADYSLIDRPKTWVLQINVYNVSHRVYHTDEGPV